MVSAVGALLAPICLAAGATMGGVLDPRDLAIDAQGRLWYAPTARAPNRVELGTARHVAPETLRGAAPTAESALYGLGALLYRWLTGAPLPPPGRVPPSVGSVRPDAPRVLTDAIDALLAPTPEARRRACGAFVAGPICLRPGRETASLPTVSPAKERVPVVVRPGTIRRGDLPRVAAALRLTEEEAHDWHTQGAPLVLSVHEGIVSSNQAIQRWRAQGLSAERWRLPGPLAWVGPGLAATVSVGAAMTAGVGAWLDAAPLVWTAGALATSFAAAAVLATRQVALRLRSPVDLLGATRRTAEGRARLRDAVRALQEGGWPDAASRDLMALVKSLEHALDAWDADPEPAAGAGRIPYDQLLGAVARLAAGAHPSFGDEDAEAAALQAQALVADVRAQLHRTP
jgi:hypothetical protein